MKIIITLWRVLWALPIIIINLLMLFVVLLTYGLGRYTVFAIGLAAINKELVK